MVEFVCECCAHPYTETAQVFLCCNSPTSCLAKPLDIPNGKQLFRPRWDDPILYGIKQCLNCEIRISDGNYAYTMEDELK